VLEPTQDGIALTAQTHEVFVDYLRETALQIALQHHKINGGMLHPTQVIDNAKQFHAYLKGETA